MSAKYTKLLFFFIVLLLFSLAFIFTGIGGTQIDWLEGESGLMKPGLELDDILRPEEGSLSLSMALAVVTAVASAGGFIATTYFAMRDDRRQAAVHQLQIDSLKKEIVHKDLEIKQLHQELSKELSS